MPFGILNALTSIILDTKGWLSVVNFLNFSFFLLRTTLSSLAMFPYKGGPLEKCRHFPSFYYSYYFFQVLELAVANSFLPNPGPRVSDFSPETLIWKLFTPVEN